MGIAKLADPAKRYGSIQTRSELFEKYERCFKEVTAGYLLTRQLSPVVACEADPDARTSRSVKLTSNGINFICDVERATEDSLSGKPELEAAWFAIVAGETVAPKLAKDVIARCGRVYAARKLEPRLYFRSNKYPEQRAA